MTCNEHKTYKALRAPRSECEACWQMYFEVDTEERRNKYLEEYYKYIKSNKDVPEEKKPSIAPKLDKNVDTQGFLQQNEFVDTEIPLKLNTYFWSDELQTSVKLTGVNKDLGVAIFHVDLVKKIPLDHLKDLKLIPLDRGYFYGVKHIMPVDLKIPIHLPKKLADNLVSEDDRFYTTDNKSMLNKEDLWGYPSDKNKHKLPVEDESELMEMSDNEPRKKKRVSKKKKT